MTMNLFDQFSPPCTLFVSLMTISILFPIMLPTPQPRPLPDRMTALKMSLFKSFLKQILPPTHTQPHPWALPALTLIYFLGIVNLAGLLPYTFTPSTQLSMDLGLAIPLWLVTILTGIVMHPTAYIGHILPLGTPLLLIPFLIIIETVSLLIRPLALGVRLAANMTAGHLLLHLVSVAGVSLFTILPQATCLTTVTLVALILLELAVAVIQAYVFTLLFILYLEETT